MEYLVVFLFNPRKSYEHDEHCERNLHVAEEADWPERSAFGSVVFVALKR